MPQGVVVVYFCKSGGRLTTHQKALLESDARVIAEITKYDFGGTHKNARDYHGHVFFVPDDTLLTDEALRLGIRDQRDFFGGAVPHPFVKTKAITHCLVDDKAERPAGWRPEFGEKVRPIVLPGYTAFSARDARIAATRLLLGGTVRVKNSVDSGAKGQSVVRSPAELEVVLDALASDQLATYGLVLEANLHEVTTLSVGQITVNDVATSYVGVQRLVPDNKGRSVYGGSTLVCVRGDWGALARLSLQSEIRGAIEQAKLYDGAMSEYPGFMASRRNYDVGQGLDDSGRRVSGVLESSWRVGGASPAELSALKAFVSDPALQVVEATHMEEFGHYPEPPRNAIVHFRGDDPRDGPIIRYTVVTRNRPV